MSNEKIHTKVIVVCLAFVFLASALSVLTLNAQAEPYQQVIGIGSVPVATTGPAAFVTDDGTLYVIGGGSSFGSPFDTVQRYGLENKTTSYGTVMPSARQWPSYTMGHDGNMYLFGGFHGGYQADVQIYGPLNNTWWTRTAPTGFGVGCAVTLSNGSMVIFNGDWEAKTTMYNPTTNTWYTMSPAPSGASTMGGRSAVVINNTAILVMGGGGGGLATHDTCEIYNPVADSWSTAASLPQDSAFGGAVMGDNGYIYYFGGYTGTGWPSTTPRNAIQRYDIAADSWSTVSSTIAPAKDMFGTAQDQYGRTFIVAGVDATPNPVADIDMLLTVDLADVNVVKITSPGAGSVVSDTVSVSAMMTSKTSGVDPLLAEFYVDGGLVDNSLGSSTIRSWTFMWNTVGLTDGSAHTLIVQVYLDNGNITKDAIQVIVSAENVDQKIADLENQITLLQSDLKDLTDKTNASDASAAQNISALQDQISLLQSQLNSLQTTTGSAKDSASSANMFAMIGMLVAIIVLVLVIINIMMSRTKK
jgi:Bacterial Ig domain/FlxA-like protein/Kelch motif